MISENLARIQDRILQVCRSCGRNPQDIRLLCVTKGRSVAEIRAALDCGISEIGESRVQEALEKIPVVSISYNDNIVERKPVHKRAPAVFKLHMIGHLQTNKVKDAVRIFDVIQSVDSLRLAAEIDKQAAKINKIQDILLEIKTSSEATKYGIAPEDAASVFDAAEGFKNIRICGLMTIAPVVDTPEAARPYFGRLRELRDKLDVLRPSSHVPLCLSMGMSDDFEVAIEEGATMVRIGRAIFER
jgi:PLP dependent protein